MGVLITTLSRSEQRSRVDTSAILVVNLAACWDEPHVRGMPATPTTQPDLQANMPTLASHCSSELIRPEAQDRWYAVTSARH